MTQRAERGMGRAVAEEKMSDGEIRYRFKTVDDRFKAVNERLDRRDEADAKRGELTWGKILGVASLVSTLLAAIVGAWMTTKGIAK